MQRSRLELALGLLLAAWLWARKLIAPAIRGPLVDYGKHYDSAYLVLANMRIVGVADGYYYPTFLALIHQPLFWFGAAESAIVWSIANLILVLAGSMVLADLLRQTDVVESGFRAVDLLRGFMHRSSLIVVLVAVGAFEPLQRVLGSGNVDPLNFFLASMLLALLVTQRDWRAGVIAGVICLVKIVPILLVPVLIVLGRWRTLAGMGAVLFAYIVWLLATGWWRDEVFLFREILPGVPWLWQHISLSVHRLAATFDSPWILDDHFYYARFILAMNVLTGISYCVLLVAAFWRGIAHPDLLLAAGLVTILLFSPLLETIHFSWILPAFAVQARAWIGGRLSDAKFAVLVVAWSGLAAADTITSIIALPLFDGHNWMLQTLLYLFLMVVSLWVGLAKAEPSRQSATDAQNAEPEAASA